jgi:hypothetical protein
MTLKEQLQEILDNPQSPVEQAVVSKHLKLTRSEDKILGSLAQAYSLPKNQVIRRLIRQAAINYSQDGEEIALLKYNQ